MNGLIDGLMDERTERDREGWGWMGMDGDGWGRMGTDGDGWPDTICALT